jgi:hypothetical protein
MLEEAEALTMPQRKIRRRAYSAAIASGASLEPPFRRTWENIASTASGLNVELERNRILLNLKEI